MRKICVVVFCLVAIFFLTGMVSAEEDPLTIVLEDTMDKLKTVDASGFDFVGTVEQMTEGEWTFSFSSVLQKGLDLLASEIKTNTGLLIKMLILSVLSGVLCNLQQNMPEENTTEIGFLVCLSVIAGLSATIVSDVVGLADKTIDSLLLFMQSLMPVVGSITVDNPAIAVSFYPALFVSMQSFTYLCKGVFLPLVLVVTALSVINALSHRFHVGRLIEFARQGVKWGIGILLTVFVGILSVRGLNAGATGLAGRTVKYALCNFVPLVGSVLAETTSSVVNSVRVIRRVVGVSGAVAAVSLCAAPVLKILAVSVLYRFAAGVAEPATDKRIIAFFVDLSGNIALVLAILVMVCVMFVISVAMLCLLL